ncbi:MAG: response regulator [Chloroflexi bacterium]|nr:response regulator [Chloroflexota bacterium]
MKTQSTQFHSRLRKYILLSVFLVSGGLALQNVQWQNTARTHTLLESVTIFLALFIAVMAFVRYYSKKKNIFLLISAGFLGTALLDGYHLIVTSSLFVSSFPSASPALVPWSELAPRLFLAVLMALSWLGWYTRRKLQRAKGDVVREGYVYFVTILLVLIVFCIFVLAPLPRRVYYPEGFIHRPSELVPAFFFLVAVVGYLYKGDWKQNSSIEHWLILSLLTNLFAHVPFMSASAQLFDAMFSLAHMVKIASYANVLAGLLVSTYVLFKQAEESIQDMQQVNVQLQSEIVERQRAEAALREAKVAAEEALRIAETANRAKSVFLANMSHELRTPLNAILGFSELMAGGSNLTYEQQENLETIGRSGDTLLSIINNILDFSKIEAGRMEMENHPLYPRDCVETTLNMLAVKATEKGLEMACLVDAQVPTAILGDVTRLRQILVNLVNNAVKFTQEGEVVVQVTSRRVDESENGVRHEIHFLVRDTGIGIPKDRMDRLFQSFSQVDSSMTRKYGGTGLGLVISKRLSELMGGRMWVESPASPLNGGAAKRGGPGSAFHFTIQAEETFVPPPAYLRDVQPDLQGRRILIVDDNASIRHILTLQARAWGMRPHDTALPTEALDWIRTAIRDGDPFDVAVLDVQTWPTGVLEETDGMTLVGRIRKEQSAKSLPLVLLGSLGPREGNAIADDEFISYLTKPIRASQLYNALLKVCTTVEDAQAQQHESVIESQFDIQMADRLPLRILLAEDNAVNQKLALRLLERMGYRADVAGNGLEAIEALRRQQYDVILMDVQMPEMDGLEATHHIREKMDAKQQPRVIAMTANAMQEDRERCLAAGMDDYVSKPVRVEELVDALKKCRMLEQV